LGADSRVVYILTYNFTFSLQLKIREAMTFLQTTLYSSCTSPHLLTSLHFGAELKSTKDFIINKCISAQYEGLNNNKKKSQASSRLTSHSVWMDFRSGSDSMNCVVVAVEK
jgi:hypothetical protein